MLNEAIYKQPLVVFLGAGASAPLGMKTTVQFIDWVRTHRKTDPGLITQVLRNAKASKEVGRRKDIEAVLDCLENIIDSSELYKKLNLVDTVKSISKLNDIVKLRNHIQDLVVEHYSAIESDRAFSHYAPLLKDFLAPCLPVFTTNYDLSMEKCYENTNVPFHLIDGFRKTGVTIPHWSETEYRNYRPEEEGRDIILFKLHGSVDWHRTPSDEIQRIEAGQRDPGNLKTVIVYPSRTKREIHEEPFRTNYDYLLACLAHTQTCVVIGFSFRDQEIVEHFREASGINKDFRVVVFDTNKKIEAYIGNKFTPSRGLKVVQIPSKSSEMTIEYVAQRIEKEMLNKEM